jgi:hypothetical protein
MNAHRSYKIDRNNHWDFDKTYLAKHFTNKRGRFTCFAVFRRAEEGKEGQEGTRAIEGTKSSKRDRGQ